MKRDIFDKKELKDIVRKMKYVEQQVGVQTIWEHGLSVAFKYKEIISELNLIADGNVGSNVLSIPKSIKDNARLILDNIKLKPEIIQKYLVFHDMGKILCRTTDEFG